MTELKVGDLIWMIWGWPGPDYCYAIVTKIEGDDFEYYDLTAKEIDKGKISDRKINFVGGWDKTTIDKLYESNLVNLEEFKNKNK